MANSQVEALYEMNVAYGVCLADCAAEEEDHGEKDYYGTNDPDSSSGFTGDIEAHYEVYRHS